MGEVDDGGFYADGGGAAFEDEGDFVAEGTFDVLGFCGADVAEGVSAGCGEWELACFEEAAEDGVSGHADGDGGEAGGDDIGDVIFFL